MKKKKKDENMGANCEPTLT